jgi:phosphonopyruvate decarboxylase
MTNAAPPQMIESRHFLLQLIGQGYNFFAGVPCSDLGGLFEALTEQKDVVSITATSEGEALSLAAGAYLAGKKPCVLCQNSGFGNLINPLMTHCSPQEIPILIVMSWRGHPDLVDEPQHLRTGAAVEPMIEQMGYDYCVLRADNFLAVERRLEQMSAECSQPYFMLVPPGTLSKASTRTWQAVRKKPAASAYHPKKNTGTKLPTRTEAIKTLVNQLSSDAIVVSSVGFNSRTVLSLADRDLNYYVPGAMGFASAIGLGIALCKPAQNVIVLDGDGSAIMHLGNLVSIGAQSPRNLTYLILNNGMHESTGGQPAPSTHIDFKGIAIACGFELLESIECISRTNLGLAAQNNSRPRFIEVQTELDPDRKPPRPSQKPSFFTQRFRAALARYPQ